MHYCDIQISIFFAFFFREGNPKKLRMEGMKGQIKTMLQGIERYNPDNIKTLEHYVDLQVN